MFTLKSVLIEGLWGRTPPLRLDFSSDYNFLIGKNGCGKTTVINLIAAVLVCDYERLDKIPFDCITLLLSSESSRKIPSVEVRKVRKSGVPFLDISYAIRKSKSAKPEEFNGDQFSNPELARHLSQRFIRDRFLKENINGAKNALDLLAKVSWLSVHRKSEEEAQGDDRKNIPAVDQKLNSLSNDLVKYFSVMSKKYETETQDFQKKSFLSLITYEKTTQVYDFVKNVHLETEKNGLSEVFALLRLEPREYSEKLKQSYEKFAEARSLYVEQKPMALEQFFSIFNAIKSHSLVKFYDDLKTTSDKIFKPRKEFVRVLNELFEGRKVVSISPRNELCVQTRNGAEIKLAELSSGEKQLIIILGEALLQESEPVIYIADEPELSLHISWQEQLTSAITRLNPKAQILFATHSPDIVGRHQDKVLDMEKVNA